MMLVPLLNPKFATVPAGRSCELRVRGTSREQVIIVRAVFAICAVCLALAIYSGHRIMAETHLHTEPSPIPGVSNGAHRDSIATLEHAQRIRASLFAITAARPASTLTTIFSILSER
jgi:hypothetical protein